MKIIKSALKEFGTLLVAALAILAVWPWFCIGPIYLNIFVFGIIYNFSKIIYDQQGRSQKDRFRSIVTWLESISYQTWNVFKFIFLMIGFIIDLFGNVFLGELIRQMVTTETDTLLGKGGVTISAGLGDLLRRGKLDKGNGRGERWCKWLSMVDMRHENHCIAAIELYEYKKNQK